MNMPVRAVSNERDERRSTDLIRVAERLHQAAPRGALGRHVRELPRERVSRPTRAAIARTSHQYMWDMMRAKRRAVPGRALRHRRHHRARHRLLQGRRRRLRGRPPPAAAARAALGRQVEHGDPAQARRWRTTATPTPARSTASTAARCTSRRCTSSRTPCAASSAPPTASRSPASSARTAPARLQHEFGGDFMQMPVQRIFISEAGRIGVGTYAPHDPSTADIADLVGSVDLSKVSRIRRRGRPARLVVVGRGVRRQPRHARDDRDPQGEARVPLPAADPHAGEERQGVALPADPPRRDHPRAHQPRRVPQVPAGAGERGAARPHGHHPGALHPLLQGRGAHLPASSPRRRRRSARCTSTRTRCTSPRCSRCSRASPRARAKADGTEEGAPVRRRGRRGRVGHPR